MSRAGRHKERGAGGRKSGGSWSAKDLSRTLVKILRHTGPRMRPPIAVSSYQGGMVPLDTILRHPQMQKTYPVTQLTLENVQKLVRDNDKQRMCLRQGADGTWLLGAAQGHSVGVDRSNMTEITSANSEDVCAQRGISCVVHGTYKKAWQLIRQRGLKAMGRDIHFAKSDRVLTGEVTSGFRTNAEVLVYVDMPRCLADGIKFYVSENGVVLSPGVDGWIDLKYFTEVAPIKWNPRRTQLRKGEPLCVQGQLRDGAGAPAPPQQQPLSAQAPKTQSKAQIRSVMWADMAQNDTSVGTQKRNCIPDFPASARAAQLLSEQEWWGAASVVFCNPDAGQRQVRQLALAQGKTVIMALPKLSQEQCFVVLDPSRLPADALERACTIKGAKQLGRMITPREAGHIDVFVCGSVVVNHQGQRVGKGGGFSDLEFGLCSLLHLVDSETRVVTTVHECQVWTVALPEQQHDFRVDFICTPMAVLPCENTSRQQPNGIYWRQLQKKHISSIPILKRMQPQSAPAPPAVPPQQRVQHAGRYGKYTPKPALDDESEFPSL